MQMKDDFHDAFIREQALARIISMIYNEDVDREKAICSLSIEYKLDPSHLRKMLEGMEEVFAAYEAVDYDPVKMAGINEAFAKMNAVDQAQHVAYRQWLKEETIGGKNERHK
jgi:hypothetical protein